MTDVTKEIVGLQTFLPFTRPCISDEAIQEVVNCLKSGWITTGPRVQKFEEQLQEYLSAPYAITVASATAGLFLALKALDLQPGDEVITTPLTFVSTLNTIVQNNLRPVLVDIDRDTFNIDAEALEAKITSRTKVILPVHFAGLSVNLDKIYAIAMKYNLRVVEDAAHALGTKYHAQQIGGFGDIQVFSFQANKNITCAEGGCIVTRDKAIHDKIKILRFHGIDRTAWDRFSKSGSQSYDVISPGYKYNLTDLQASIGLDQLKHLETFITKRNDIATRYLQSLNSCKNIKLPAIDNDPNNRHSWHLFTVLVNNRDEIMQKLKDFNIGTGLHYRPVHLFTFYKENYGWELGDFPNAEYVGDRIMSLPLFPDLCVEDQNVVIECLREIVNE